MFVLTYSNGRGTEIKYKKSIPNTHKNYGVAITHKQCYNITNFNLLQLLEMLQQNYRCDTTDYFVLQVVRGKMSSQCLWHACRALSAGLLLMLLGAAMATIGT